MGEGRRLDNGGEAVRFDMVVDGKHLACLVSREVLNDLSQSNARGDDLLSEFDKHRAVIAEKSEKAIRGGLAGDPLLIPSEMFFPRGKPLHKLIDG
jgi:hypothetical protein